MLNEAEQRRDSWALIIVLGLLVGALAGTALFKTAHAPEEPAAASAGSNTQYPDP